MKPRFCFLDMDGVIVDFVSGACEAHGCPNPYEDTSNLREFNIAKIWGISDEDFWQPITDRGFDFWRNLAPTVEAKELVSLLESYFGTSNIAILTSPSQDPQCIPGKRAWIKHHFPQFEKQMLFGKAKHFLAGPDRLLIDDQKQNILNWRAAEGLTITMPRPWNDYFRHQSLDYAKYTLQKYFL